jgi:hypothetical protein
MKESLQEENLKVYRKRKAKYVPYLTADSPDKHRT